jgi:hypothetical protein
MRDFEEFKGLLRNFREFNGILGISRFREI